MKALWIVSFSIMTLFSCYGQKVEVFKSFDKFLCKSRRFKCCWLSMLLPFMFLLSCNLGEKEQYQTGDVPFYAVDFLEIEKMKGIDMPLSEVVENWELIRLENKEEALSKTNPWGVNISENYLLIKQDGIFPIQLFTRQGKFINNVGGLGQGPGEYRVIFEWVLDEKAKRISLQEGATTKLLTYNLKGEYLEDENIRLPERVSKLACWMDYGAKKAICITLPFAAIDNPLVPVATNLCWTQNFKGKVYNAIQVMGRALQPDYSNEIGAMKNVDAISFSISEVPVLKGKRERPDTLFRYDVSKNVLIPCFTLDNVSFPDRFVVSLLYETERYYWDRIAILPKGEGDFDKADYITVRVSKEDGSITRINRFVNDKLGLTYPWIVMQNGYVCITYEPSALIDELDEVLSDRSISPEVRERVTALRNSLDENDNDILMIGKLKQ